WIKKAMRLNPYHPVRFWNHLGRAYFVARRYDEAFDSFRKIDTPDQSHHAFMAAADALAGRIDAARNHARAVLKLAPDFTVTQYMTTMHYKRESDREHHTEGLRTAGLPS
ncbi:MAG TPA: tetratricopeptide repeat protein, partial [Dongiaceae bacterium]|nr:tetratricopeptide repeat protein [Dongiaceae bacterium]